MAALPPGKLPELQKTDLRHLHAGVGLNAPEQIRTSPRSEMVALGGIPEETQNVAHGLPVV